MNDIIIKRTTSFMVSENAFIATISKVHDNTTLQIRQLQFKKSFLKQRQNNHAPRNHKYKKPEASIKKLNSSLKSNKMFNVEGKLKR